MRSSAQMSLGGRAPHHQQQMRADLDRRRDAPQRQLYQALDQTKEYEEAHYWKMPWPQVGPTHLHVSEFWNDYAQHLLSNSDQPFLSKHFLKATKNFTEMIFAISVLDLPFECDGPVPSRDGAKLVLRASKPCVVFSQELLETPQLPSSVLVSQNYFDPRDPHVVVDGERQDKFIRTEFLTRHVYSCRITLTNVSSTSQSLEMLIQVPQGSLPMNNGFRTRTEFVALGSYKTKVVDYSFYFPFAGQFRHYPVHVSKKGKLIGRGDTQQLKVVTERTEADLTSWRYVSQEGTNDEVIQFLETNNVFEVNIHDILWRMKDKDFFLKVTALLRKQQHVDLNVWAYSLLHGSTQEMREYLSLNTRVTNMIGGYFQSCLVNYDPFIRKKYQHLEYKPLVNARAHQLGKERKILNQKFQTQYTDFLKQLCYKGTDRSRLSSKDLMEATYYMLLQDRIDEAIDLFQSIQNGHSCPLVFDYMSAYLDFYKDNPNGPQVARDIATKYRDHCIVKKRKLFADVEKQLSELDYKNEEIDHPDVKDVHRDVGDRDRKMDEFASSAPTYDVDDIENNEIRISFANIGKLTVNFYLMDIELLFSTSPFLKEGNTMFSMVAPNRSIEVELPKVIDAQSGAHAVAIPEELCGSNVYIEILGEGIVRSKTHYANQLSVKIIENYGQLKVNNKDTGAPVGRAYVKVYSKLNSGVTQFYKDGYTDFRGMFDYSVLSTDQMKNTEKFSILIMSEQYGGVVREAAKPTEGG